MIVTWLLIYPAVLLIAFISLLHIYWAFGGHWGGRSAVPALPTAHGEQPVFRPGRTPTLIVAVLLGGAAMLLLVQSQIVSPPTASQTWVTTGSILCASAFSLRVIGDFRYVGLFKRIRATHFAYYDTLVFTPLCLYLALAYWAAILN